MKITNAYQGRLARIGGNTEATVPHPANTYQKLLGDIPTGGEPGSGSNRLVVTMEEDYDSESGGCVSSVSYSDLVAAIEAGTDIAVKGVYVDSYTPVSAEYVRYTDECVTLTVSWASGYDAGDGTSATTVGTSTHIALNVSTFEVGTDGRVTVTSVFKLTNDIAQAVPFTISGSIATFPLNLGQLTMYLLSGCHIRFCTHRDDTDSGDSSTPWYEFNIIDWTRKTRGSVSSRQYGLTLQRTSFSGSTMTVETVTMAGTGSDGFSLLTGTYSSTSYTLSA